MIYIEKNTLHKRTFGLLGLVLVLIYLLPLAMMPVRGREARLSYLANRRTVDSSGQRENPLLEKSPYTLLARGLYCLLAPQHAFRDAESSPPGPLADSQLPPLAPHRAAWSLRLPVFLSLGLLIWPMMRVLRGETGKVSAWLAAAVVLTYIPLVGICQTDLRVVFLGSLISAAWFFWYYFARHRKSWDRAWAAAGFFMMIACLEGGTWMLVPFYFPLVFLRRPFRIWQRMLNPVHLITLGAILILSIFWTHYSHAGDALEAIRQGYAGEGGRAGLSFLARLVVFPLVFIVLFMPWPAIVWPAYCAAFKPLEKNAVFGHFLRTLVLPVFIFLWLMPGLRWLPLLLLIAPLACLATLNYELLVRRHIQGLRRFAKALRRIIPGLCGLIILFLILNKTGLVVFLGVKPQTEIFAAAYAALSLTCILISRRCRNWAPYWVELMCVALAGICVLEGLVLPTVDLVRRDTAREAAGLTKNIPEGTPIFMLQRGSVAATAFHTGHRIFQVRSPEEIPESWPEVYVWGSGRAPIAESRKWERVSEAFYSERPDQFLFRRNPDRPFGWIVEMVHTEDPDRGKLMRMYRGALEPKDQRLLVP